MIVVPPSFNHNYKVGQLYFTNTILTVKSPGAVISKGISFFTKHEAMKNLQEVFYSTHVGVVTGYRKGVEAHIWTGVQEVDLESIFDDPYTRIFFKEPILLNELGSQPLVDLMKSKIGEKYDPMLILGQLFTLPFPEPFRSKVLHKFNRGGYICCELVAWALREGGFMQGFDHPADYRWSPIELFGAVFLKSWKDDPKDLR